MLIKEKNIYFKKLKLLNVLKSLYLSTFHQSNKMFLLKFLLMMSNLFLETTCTPVKIGIHLKHGIVLKNIKIIILKSICSLI